MVDIVGSPFAKIKKSNELYHPHHHLRHHNNPACMSGSTFNELFHPLRFPGLEKAIHRKRTRYTDSANSMVSRERSSPAFHGPRGGQRESTIRKEMQTSKDRGGKRRRREVEGDASDTGISSTR